MGTEIAPVVGSGSCPAWIASVEKPTSGRHVFEEVEPREDSGRLAVLVHGNRGVARGEQLHHPRQVRVHRDGRERLLDQVLEPGLAGGGALRTFCSNAPSETEPTTVPSLSTGSWEMLNSLMRSSAREAVSS